MREKEAVMRPDVFHFYVLCLTLTLSACVSQSSSTGSAPSLAPDQIQMTDATKADLQQLAVSAQLLCKNKNDCEPSVGMVLSFMMAISSVALVF
jgi:hypothetical protein